MDASGGYTPRNLSPRQRDVLKLIVRGLSNKEIARSLNLAEGTIKIHVAALFAKLGVHRRAAVAVAGGVLSLPAGVRYPAKHGSSLSPPALNIVDVGDVGVI